MGLRSPGLLSWVVKEFNLEVGIVCGSTPLLTPHRTVVSLLPNRILMIKAPCKIVEVQAAKNPNPAQDRIPHAALFIEALLIKLCYKIIVVVLVLYGAVS